MTAARVVVALCFCLLPQAAAAHVAAPGLAGFTAAMIHVATEPPAPLALVGLGLALGTLDDTRLLTGCMTFALGLLAGLVLGLATSNVLRADLPLIGVALVSGTTTAAGLCLQRWAVAVLALVGGCFFGVLATPDPAPWDALAMSAAGGVIGALWALMVLAISVRMALQRWTQPWMTIGVRVAGSWIAAISGLLFALAIANSVGPA